MKYYWVKTHWLARFLFPAYTWKIRTLEKTVYLTFDDGPTPEITDWVLQQLDSSDYKATFFCIGNNVDDHPEIFERIVSKGHAVGNHTYNHVNGWHIPTEDYILDAEKCEGSLNKYNPNKLFRPPYGKLKRAQLRRLRALGYKIIMWDILSADFDNMIQPEKCLQNVVRNIVPGSIIIFHDSLKASSNLKYALPETLKFLKENGYEAKVLP